MKPDEVPWQESEQTLHWERAIDAGRIPVHVHNGVVTLTGTVPDTSQKLAVEKALQRVDGCRVLVMELCVSPASAYLKSDEMLAARIVAALSRMPDLPADRVRVRTERGCVALTGSLQREKQRHEVEELIANMEGVVGVSNRLAVSEPPVDDVAARIALTLNGRLKWELGNLMVDISDGNDTACLVDEEIRRMLDDAHARVRATLSSQRATLECIARLLHEREVLDHDMLQRAIDGASPSEIDAPARRAVEKASGASHAPGPERAESPRADVKTVQQKESCSG